MSKPADKQHHRSISITADEQTQSGAYSNLGRISHDAESFTVDFVFVHASPAFARLVSRVILSPGHAKRLAKALADNVRSYEAKHGPIPSAPSPTDNLGPIQ